MPPPTIRTAPRLSDQSTASTLESDPPLTPHSITAPSSNPSSYAPGTFGRQLDWSITIPNNPPEHRLLDLRRHYFYPNGDPIANVSEERVNSTMADMFLTYTYGSREYEVNFATGIHIGSWNAGTDLLLDRDQNLRTSSPDAPRRVRDSPVQLQILQRRMEKKKLKIFQVKRPREVPLEPDWDAAEYTSLHTTLTLKSVNRTPATSSMNGSYRFISVPSGRPVISREAGSSTRVAISDLRAGRTETAYRHAGIVKPDLSHYASAPAAPPRPRASVEVAGTTLARRAETGRRGRDASHRVSTGGQVETERDDRVYIKAMTGERKERLDMAAHGAIKALAYGLIEHETFGTNWGIWGYREGFVRFCVVDETTVIWEADTETRELFAAQIARAQRVTAAMARTTAENNPAPAEPALVDRAYGGASDPVADVLHPNHEAAEVGRIPLSTFINSISKPLASRTPNRLFNPSGSIDIEGCQTLWNLFMHTSNVLLHHPITCPRLASIGAANDVARIIRNAAHQWAMELDRTRSGHAIYETVYGSRESEDPNKRGRWDAGEGRGPDDEQDPSGDYNGDGEEEDTEDAEWSAQGETSAGGGQSGEAPESRRSGSDHPDQGPGDRHHRAAQGQQDRKPSMAVGNNDVPLEDLVETEVEVDWSHVRSRCRPKSNVYLTSRMSSSLILSERCSSPSSCLLYFRPAAPFVRRVCEDIMISHPDHIFRWGTTKPSGEQEVGGRKSSKTVNAPPSPSLRILMDCLATAYPDYSVVLVDPRQMDAVLMLADKSLTERVARPASPVPEPATAHSELRPELDVPDAVEGNKGRIGQVVDPAHGHPEGPFMSIK